MMNFPKRCGCGKEHAALEWNLLQYVGEQDDGVEQLELRNCPCGSTIAIVLVSTEIDIEDPPARSRSAFRAAETIPAGAM